MALPTHFSEACISSGIKIIGSVSYSAFIKPFACCLERPLYAEADSSAHYCLMHSNTAFEVHKRNLDLFEL